MDKTIRSLYRHILIGFLGGFIFLGGGLLWATTVDISGAIIAPGLIAVESGTKKIQPPVSGVVNKIFVREGQSVSAGDVLVSLDPTVQSASLKIISSSLNKIYTQNARLEAEANELPQVVMPAELLERLPLDDAEALIGKEDALFLKRREARNGQKSQLLERIAQLDDQISGNQKQQVSKLEEMRLIEQELRSVKILYDKGMMTLDRLNALLRASARLQGESARLLAEIAEARGKIAEIKIQVIQIDQIARNESLATLRDNSMRADELVEREIAARHQLSQIDIKAPISGQVFQLSIHTVGGVVTAAEHLMDVVPRNADMIVEARVNAEDVDQLVISQKATLRLTAFNRNTTPELLGQIERISADLITDERTQLGYYKVGIRLRDEEVKRLGGLALIPGMPVEVFIATGSRSVMSYLIKPIVDHTQRAFRES